MSHQPPPLPASAPPLPARRSRRSRAWPPHRWPVWLQFVAMLLLLAVASLAPGWWELLPYGLLLAIVFGSSPHAPPAASVRWVPRIDFATASSLLAAEEREVLHLDGRCVRDAAALGRALDAALGAFEHPTEPLSHVLAHVGFESRGAGRKVLVWTDARELAERDPDTFAAFVAAWSEQLEVSREVERLLVVDLPPPAPARPQASANGSS